MGNGAIGVLAVSLVVKMVNNSENVKEKKIMNYIAQVNPNKVVILNLLDVSNILIVLCKIGDFSQNFILKSLKKLQSIFFV